VPAAVPAAVAALGTSGWAVASGWAVSGVTPRWAVGSRSARARAAADGWAKRAVTGMPRAAQTRSALVGVGVGVGADRALNELP